MPIVNFDNAPVGVVWPVTRGDDETLPLQFAEPGGYTVTRVNGVETVTVTDALDITGRTYDCAVVASLGGTTVVSPTVTVDSAANGQITLSMTDTQTATLTAARYLFVLRENPATTSTNTIIIGRMPVISGRALS
jgi:hypothetical protein